jgi:hypothetical protein
MLVRFIHLIIYLYLIFEEERGRGNWNDLYSLLGIISD